MNNRIYLSFLFGILSVVYAPGQSDDASLPPKAPYIASMPDGTKSIVQVSVKDYVKLPAQVAKLVQITNTILGNARQLVSIFSDGTRSEIWFVDGYRLEQVPGAQWILVTLSPRNLEEQNSDFPDLEWIGLKNYTKNVLQNGINCYEYKMQLVEPLQKVTLDYAAYIDIKTKRPVIWEVGPYHFELTSVVPITSMPDMPPAYAKKLKEYLDATRRISH